MRDPWFWSGFAIGAVLCGSLIGLCFVLWFSVRLEDWIGTDDDDLPADPKLTGGKP